MNDPKPSPACAIGACSLAGLLGRSRWSPYLVGAGIGVLSWITFGLMHKALGTSTTFVNVVALFTSLFAPAHVEGNEYLAKQVVTGTAIDWQMMLVLGVFIGAFVSARLGGGTQVEHVPALWQWRFGSSMAGGCTSGHGISGGLQLAVSSWTFFVAFFAAALLTAFALFGKEGRSHV
jgi:uncharacterized membrane protein YedE/YeeE